MWRFLQPEPVAGKKPTCSRVGVDLIAGQGGACCSKEPGEVGAFPRNVQLCLEGALQLC